MPELITEAEEKPVDAVLLNYLLTGVAGNAIDGLIQHAHKVLNTGGQFVVHDFMVEDERSGSELAALWQLQHMAITPDAVSIRPGWLSDKMARQGIGGSTVRTMIPPMTKLVWAEKRNG